MGLLIPNTIETRVMLQEKREESLPPPFLEGAPPRHVALIMDGNRRWAEKWGLPIKVGHWKGAQNLMKIVKAAVDLEVEVLTVFTFSTENWSRSPQEISAILELLKETILEKKKEMVANGIRLRTIGDLSKFPEDIQEVLAKSIEETAKGESIELVLALNYGARDEVRRAIASIAEDYKNGLVQKEEITESLINNYLDTAPFGDPDLLIRTSGELRLSNFLLWQISYSEVYITDVLWPDFSKRDFVAAITEFQKRTRRLGS